MNELEQRILQVYKEKSNRCEDCRGNCQKRALEMHGPLSFFNIGNEFEKDRYKIVFVGKNTWYDKKDVDNLSKYPESTFRDCRAGGRDMFEHHSSRFWGCIREITLALYPEHSSDFDILLNHIALTNLTKCNTSKGSLDTTPYFLTKNCIEFFEEEVKILQPKHLILFTSMGYDPYVAELNFGYSKPPKNITDRTNRKVIGNGNVCWWKREFSDGNRESMLFLRTRHPVRAPKGLVSEIVTWIKE